MRFHAELVNLTVVALLLPIALATAADVSPAAAQAEAAADSNGASYYDFWPGDWHQVIDGEVADEPRFQVAKNLHPRSFEETWHMDDYQAKAWRVWDGSVGRWMFVWISDQGHFQIWEERKVGDYWYMFKEFVIDGESVLSRQAFIPQEDGTVIRTSEHSLDDGKTWTLRFKEILVKKP